MSRPSATAESRENLLDLTPEAAEIRLRVFFDAIGEPAYRAKQIVRHLWTAPVATFDEK